MALRWDWLFVAVGGICSGLGLGLWVLGKVDASAAATMIGSGLGAAFSVLGAFTVVSYQVRAGEREFESFISDVVENLRYEAILCNQIATDFERVKEGTEWKRQRSRLMHQFDAIEAVVVVFDRHVAGRQLGRFMVRRELYKLETGLKRLKLYFAEKKKTVIADDFDKDKANELWDVFAGVQVGCQSFLMAIGRKYRDLSEDEMMVLLNDIDAYSGFGGDILPDKYDGTRKRLLKRLPDLAR